MKRKGATVRHTTPDGAFQPNVMRTAVEVYQDGHREVYHRRVDGSNSGWAWTHPDTPKERKACTACQRGTLVSVKKKEAQR